MQVETLHETLTLCSHRGYGADYRQIRHRADAEEILHS